MKNHVVLPVLLIAVIYSTLAVNSDSLDTATFSASDKKLLLDVLAVSIFYYSMLSAKSILDAFVAEAKNIFKNIKNN
jgi:hypothetical protein